jgi:hypothetical protein
MPVEPSNLPTESNDPPIEAEWNADTPWWRPGLSETIQLIGWWWLLVIPVSGVLLFVVLAPTDPQIRAMMWIGWIKLIVAVIALPFVLSTYVFAKAMKFRHEPFCIHCGHTLMGLPDNHRCPECGRRYRFAIIEAYRSDPESFVYRWKAQQMPRCDRPLVNDRSKR